MQTIRDRAVCYWCNGRVVGISQHCIETARRSSVGNRSATAAETIHIEILLFACHYIVGDLGDPQFRNWNSTTCRAGNYIHFINCTVVQ